MAKRNTSRAAQGAGSIRKKTVTRKGKQYEYWEARVTVGRDPGTGKQIQKSITGKTQKEVREKLQAVSVEINDGTYHEPEKMTVGEWLDIWTAEYLGDVKPRTADSYKTTVRVHLKPAFGAVRLSALRAHEIQALYNRLQNGTGGKDGLSPKSIKNLHGVLHKALQQAVELGYIKINPAGACKLPRIEKAAIKPLDEKEIARFMEVIKGHPFENLYLVTLFTGMRESEVLGLMWECVDFENGTILIDKQLQRKRGEDGSYHFVSPKNGKSRCITPAPFVMEVLQKQKRAQWEARVNAGVLWENTGLVFTNEYGRNYSAQTVYLHFKKLVAAAGAPDTRFHDLRHSFAVVSLQSGDDIKTVQENLGHHTAAFTLDVYGHVTEKMKRDSAARMERFISGVSNL